MKSVQQGAVALIVILLLVLAVAAELRPLLPGLLALFVIATVFGLLIRGR